MNDVQLDLRSRYTRVKKIGSKWNTYLQIDHQGFCVAEQTSCLRAKWYSKMLSIALERLIKKHNRAQPKRPMNQETSNGEAGGGLGAAPCSAKCGWLYMNGRKCGKPAIAKWTVMSSTMVCKCHAQEVNRMRMGKLTMLSPNDEVSDRRAHGNENTTGANGGSLH